MDLPVDHIDVRIYSARNQLLGQARIPAHLVPEFTALLEQARAINPTFDAALLARWIVKAGYGAVSSQLKKGHVPNTLG